MRKTTGTTGFTQLRQVTLLAAVAMSVCGVSWAQQPPSPGSSATPSAAPAPRESPRPDQLEPGVNTSAPADNSSAPAATPSAAPSPSSARGANVQPAAPSEANAQKATNTSQRGASRASEGAKGADTGAQIAAAAGPVAPKSGASGKAQDRIELDTTQITGNRELPKVLYIVPWKRSDLGDLVGKPVNSLLDEVLAPVDRDVFRRENRYYEALKPDQGGGAAAGTGAPAGPGEKH